MKIYLAKGIINGDGNVVPGDSILVKDGIISDFGDKASILSKYPSVEKKYFDGYIYPGFIDCHIHFTGTGVDMLSIDCRRVNCFSQLFAIIEAQIATLPKGGLVIGVYFDPDTYLEKAFPTIEELDEIFPNSPVFISHIECHGAIMNSSFLEYYGEAITHDNGLVVGKDNSKARQFIFNSLDEKYKLKGMMLAEKEAIKQGVTSIHAMEGGELFSNKDVETLLNNISDFKVDLIVYHQTLDVDLVKSRGLKQIGGCVLIDGSSGLYTAAMSKPYRLYPNQRGILYFTQEEITEFILNAQRNGMQVALHCCGDRGLDFLMDCFEYVDGIQKIHPFRHRIEHFEIPRPEQIVRCKKLGLVLSMQPSFDYFWGGEKGDYFYTLGERWKWANPVGKAIDAGIIVGGGSDSGVTPISPLLGIHSVVNHHNPHQRITVENGIKMFTKNAAYLAFAENDKGDIKKGFTANLTILKENLLEMPKKNIKDAEVLATIIRGEIANST